VAAPADVIEEDAIGRAAETVDEADAAAVGGGRDTHNCGKTQTTNKHKIVLFGSRPRGMDLLLANYINVSR
jgi:hypothetical protein